MRPCCPAVPCAGPGARLWHHHTAPNCSLFAGEAHCRVTEYPKRLSERELTMQEGHFQRAGWLEVGLVSS